MGIENRFLFRTGAESTDSLESLASLLDDSAYRFRSRQMRHDVTHTLLCFDSERSMASPRKKRSKVWLYFTRINNKIATCNNCKMSISAKGGTTSNMPKHLATQHAIHIQECRVFDTLRVLTSDAR